jgi:hypothetical protein
VVGAGDVDVVAGQPQAGQVRGAQPEQVGVSAHVRQRDGAGRAGARGGEEAVDPSHLARRAGEAVDVDDALRPERGAQALHRRASRDPGHRALDGVALDAGGGDADVDAAPGDPERGTGGGLGSVR